MAVNLSIKGVPQAIAERLRARAEANHRSLQGELMAIVWQAAAEPANAQAASLPAVAHAAAMLPGDAGLGGVKRGHKSIEQLAAEHLLRHPTPFAGTLPRAVDIIRADRDSR